jgi:hypothetical protein
VGLPFIVVDSRLFIGFLTNEVVSPLGFTEGPLFSDISKPYETMRAIGF